MNNFAKTCLTCVPLGLLLGYGIFTSSFTILIYFLILTSIQYQLYWLKVKIENSKNWWY